VPERRQHADELQVVTSEAVTQAGMGCAAWTGCRGRASPPGQTPRSPSWQAGQAGRAASVRHCREPGCT